MEFKFSKKNLKAKGIKISLKKGKREIARARVYILRNNLHKKPFCFLEDVFVEKDFRGKGLGTKIVIQAIKESKKLGCYKLICTSRHTKKAVHKFYKKLNFKDWGKEFRIDF